MSQDESSGNNPKSLQHFKLISEGGGYRNGSPGPLSCNDALWAVRDCTTESQKDIWRRAQGCATVPSDDQFMFTLPLEHAPDLDQGVIPESLRHGFKDQGVALSKTAELSIQHAGKIWLITDKEHKYSVRMLPTHLFVYTESK